MARGDYPSAKQDQYMLRFPDGMRDRIKALAEQNGRSMNAEIIHRLEESFRLQGGLFGLRDETETIDVSALSAEDRARMRAIALTFHRMTPDPAED